ncbi:hypothetical protein V6N11_001652 [Hibiscus sabdariffa]|uniref:Transmembrane protein n=2 Tax=Hibiscus sabdariffa TaxID=183260 RepID=A0ABR1ZUK8_9ROSI
MLKLKVLVVCVLIVAMDVAAGILGIQAQVAQNKVEHVKVLIFECRLPSHEAFKLALGAAILLSLAHVLVNLVGGWMCVSSQQEFQRASPNRQLLSLACLVFTWIVLAVGLSTLVIGMISNNKSWPSCGLRYLLSIGGILCFVHGLFSAAYYVSAAAATDRN